MWTLIILVNSFLLTLAYRYPYGISGSTQSNPVQYTKGRSSSLKRYSDLSTENEIITCSHHGKQKPSLSCLLFGNVGCSVTCHFMCVIYGCESRGPVCEDLTHCVCNEVYHLREDYLTAVDFETCPFDRLWDYAFEDSYYSNKIQARIKRDRRTKEFVLNLLKNPHQTGDDIKRALMAKYPLWKELEYLQSFPQGMKSSLMTHGNKLTCDDIADHFEELLSQMKDDTYNELQHIKYRRKMKQMLDNIEDEEELKYLLKLIRLSGNVPLHNYITSYLKKRGYEFHSEEELNNKYINGNVGGFSPSFEMTTNRNEDQLSVNTSNVDEEELIELSILKKFMEPYGKDNLGGQAFNQKICKNYYTNKRKKAQIEAIEKYIGNNAFDRAPVQNSEQNFNTVSGTSTPSLEKLYSGAGPTSETIRIDNDTVNSLDVKLPKTHINTENEKSDFSKTVSVASEKEKMSKENLMGFDNSNSMNTKLTEISKVEVEEQEKVNSVERNSDYREGTESVEEVSGLSTSNIAADEIGTSGFDSTGGQQSIQLENISQNLVTETENNILERVEESRSVAENIAEVSESSASSCSTDEGDASAIDNTGEETEDQLDTQKNITMTETENNILEHIEESRSVAENTAEVSESSASSCSTDEGDASAIDSTGEESEDQSGMQKNISEEERQNNIQEHFEESHFATMNTGVSKTSASSSNSDESVASGVYNADEEYLKSMKKMSQKQLIENQINIHEQVESDSAGQVEFSRKRKNSCKKSAVEEYDTENAGTSFGSNSGSKCQVSVTIKPHKCAGNEAYSATECNRTSHSKKKNSIYYVEVDKNGNIVQASNVRDNPEKHLKRKRIKLGDNSNIKIDDVQKYISNIHKCS